MTGGAGFIGSNFVHHLLHGGGAPCCPDADPDRRADAAEVVNIDRLTYAADRRNLHGVEGDQRHRLVVADVCDALAVETAFRDAKPEVVVHFAAESHVDRSIESGFEFARTNVLGTQVVLDAARRHDVRRFVHVSTDEVYGSREDGSFAETDPLVPSSPYSASKAGSDLLALAHRRTYGLDVVVTRCANNYGPRQHPEKFLPKLVSCAIENRPFPLYGTGRNVRDWLYVRDHCEALEIVARRGRAGEIYNIAGGEERANVDVARKVVALFGRSEALIRSVPDRPGHDFRYSVDDAKIRALGWRPRVAFDDGLRHTITWFESILKEAVR